MTAVLVFLVLLLVDAAGCGLAADGDSAADTMQWELAEDSSSGPQEPQLPRRSVETRYVAPTGRTVTVRAGADLQAALDAAQPGDALLLQAGATFTGNFTLPPKRGSGWIIIRSAAADAQLPREGTRLRPDVAPLLARIVSPNSRPALRTAARAHHYRLIGLEVTVAPSVTRNNAIVALGDGSRRQSSLDQVPHDIILDRVYIHGHPRLHTNRCLALNSASTAVIDSYLSECHAAGFDSQAICGWNGPGPFKIVNNYLEGAGENVMFGGADPSIANLTPSDIEIRRNHFTRPTSWKGVWTVKNLFELKHAQRVLVEGNVFENHWPDAQDGFAIVWKSVNQNGTAPWSVTRDVTFRLNRVRNVGGGITIAARPEPHPALPVRRVTVANNVFDNINVGMFSAHGRLFQFLLGPASVTIEHNTALNSGGSNAAVVMDVAPPQMAHFTFRGNVITRAQYGVFGSAQGEGLRGLTFYAAPGFTFEHNVLIGPNNGAVYPPKNWFPATIAAVGFVDPSAGNYRLASQSPYRRTRSGGRPPGADIDAVEKATQGVAVP